MKKNKGFTLVELIAVIVLLGIMLVISVSSVSSIKSKVNERQYKSLAITIQMAAEKFSSETGVRKMFVQTLIDAGLVSTDDETKQVYDPRNKDSLNCRIILVDDNKKAFLTDEDTKCEESLLTDEFVRILPCPRKDEVCSDKFWDEDKWYNDVLYLHPVSTNIKNIDLTKDNVLFSWTTPLAPDDVITDKILEVSDETIGDTYKLEVTIDGMVYHNEKEIKIDKHAPTITDAVVTNPSSWKPVKKVSFVLSDRLSGAAGYYITNDSSLEVPDDDFFVNTANSSRVEIKKEIDLLNDFKDYKAGDQIYIWTKDVAGNVQKHEAEFKFGNLDLSAADEGTLKMDYKPKLPEYTKTATLMGSAKDSKSGLVAYAFSENKLNKNDTSWINIPRTNEINFTDKKIANKDGTYYFCVKDEAENVDCAYVNVENTDNEINEVRIKKANADLSMKLFEEISLYAKDNKAGISHYFVSTSTSAPKEEEWIALKTPQKEFSLKYNVYENATYYLHVKDAAGNVDSSLKNKNNGGEGSVVIDNIDREGPEYEWGGEVKKGSVDMSYWTDKSLPVTLLHYITTGDETPTAEMFKNNIMTFEVADCGKRYNVWAKATDALGNYTIRKMGTYALPLCCSEGTWTSKGCGATGFMIETRYNECLTPAQNEERTTDESCTSPYEYGAWSECSNVGIYSSTCGSGSSSRTVTYYIAGKEYNTYEYKPCSCGSTICGPMGYLENDCGICYWTSCKTTPITTPWTPIICSSGNQTRTTSYWEGGHNYVNTESRKCQSIIPTLPTIPKFTLP